MDEMYTPKPDGLCGNEDCGQMSAWYVLSAMGIYSVCPGNTQYAIGSPLFGKAQINMENGKVFKVIAENNSKTNIYIKEASLNGKPLTRSWIDYSEIIDGGELHLIMGSVPNKDWASNTTNIPTNSIENIGFSIVPYFLNTSKTFVDSLTIGIATLDKEQEVYYAILNVNASNDGVKWIHGRSVSIKESSKVLAYSQDKNGNKSFAIEGKFFRFQADKTINIKSVCSKQYDAGGANGLIDGIRGETNFRLGGWQGYQDQDFEATVDLGKVKPIHRIAAGFLQDARPWIWMPKYVEFWTSDDGQNFTLVATLKHDIPENQMDVIIKDFEAKVDLSTRYIKVFAKNFGAIPSWHPGAGYPAYIFIDEIIIE